ncbi:MAG: hypothetical protein JW920_01960, partial [Deltaproteobacteria bacterium]|nr:hypothetical protein [Deltaproteobacteria bacterium]
MRNIFLIISVLIFLVISSNSFAEPIITDHLCTDLTQIPAEWIDTTQASIKGYYAHTSHGRQLTIGLETIEQTDSQYA